MSQELQVALRATGVKGCIPTRLQTEGHIVFEVSRLMSRYKEKPDRKNVFYHFLIYFTTYKLSVKRPQTYVIASESSEIRKCNLQEFLSVMYKNCYCEQRIDIDSYYRFRNAVRMKRPEKWRISSWFLVQDNAAAHRSVVVKDCIAKNKVTTLEQPPFSPDLAAADSCLLSNEMSTERATIL